MEQTKRRPGRPAVERDAIGRPARVRLTWRRPDRPDGVEHCELYGDERPALRLLEAWARNECTPRTLVVERKGVNGWEAP